MAPRVIANWKSPASVSKTMAVVRTRVRPAMLPPTMMTAPTSEMARPKATRTVWTRAGRASDRTARAAWRPSAPRERAVSAASGGTEATALAVKPITMGSRSRVWAITIATGVKRSPRSPRGPALLSRR